MGWAEMATGSAEVLTSVGAGQMTVAARASFLAAD